MPHVFLHCSKPIMFLKLISNHAQAFSSIENDIFIFLLKQNICIRSLKLKFKKLLFKDLKRKYRILRFQICNSLQFYQIFNFFATILISDKISSMHHLLLKPKYQLLFMYLCNAMPLTNSYIYCTEPTVREQDSHLISVLSSLLNSKNQFIF